MDVVILVMLYCNKIQRRTKEETQILVYTIWFHEWQTEYTLYLFTLINQSSTKNYIQCLYGIFQLLINGQIQINFIDAKSAIVFKLVRRAAWFVFTHFILTYFSVINFVCSVILLTCVCPPTINVCGKRNANFA